MTDLRDKIAATIYCHILFRALDQCECGAAFDGFCGHALDAYAAHVADAVIRELGLEQEDGECGYCQAQLPCSRYSAWETDE